VLLSFAAEICCDVAINVPEGGRNVQWTKLSEQTVYENRWFQVNLADVELPGGRHLDHFLIRLRPVAVATVVNEANEVLLLRRHRFITDSWGWELAAGVVEDGEDIERAAAREMEEETGWRPKSIEPLGSFQPMTSMIDSENYLFLARGAEDTGQARDINEAQAISWIPLDEALGLTETGEIAGAGSVVGLLKTAAIRARQDETSSDRRSVPSTMIRPSVGSYNRHRSLIRVDLPAPLAPTIAIDRPAGMDKVRPRKAGVVALE